MRGQLITSALGRPWLARLAMTLAAWVVAFLLVLALISVLGNELGSLPLAVRALVISGVVVTVMTGLVMPALNVAVGRWLARPTRRPEPAMELPTQSGDERELRDREPADRPTQGSARWW
jgi:antibiotic biosynthesis monooxygenase (ABM) superfamily enzyme